MTPTKLDELVAVRSRFHRSVDLVHDLESEEALVGYLLTPQGAELAARIHAGLSEGNAERAWTVTGPYGTGKSAFALFLATLFAQASSPNRKAAAEALSGDRVPKEARKSLLGLDSQKGFLVIPVSGTREPLARALGKATANAIRARLGSKKTWRDLTDELNRLEDRRKRPKSVETEYLELLSRVQAGASREGLDGVLLIIDELGKFLEYAASTPGEDAFILQRLAEQASRSKEHPLAIVTILHQSFERYAEMLPQSVREEWQKVQGRFTDVAFIEQSSELLRLLGSAISRPKPWPFQLANKYEKILDSGMAVGVFKAAEKNLYKKMLPLHPVTATVLPGLFRSALSQNERSLFSFLTSPHPHGFTTFLRDTETNSDALFRVDAVFDYVTETMGPSLLASTDSKRWAEALSAVERVPADASEFTRRVVKAVGVLSLFGHPSVQASQECLAFALSDGTTPSSELTEALDLLTKASILVFRRHRNAFGLWEGSDIDLNAQFLQLRPSQGAVGDIVSTLKSRVRLHPIPTRGHFFKTGTLRFFEVDVAMSGDLADEASKNPKEGDGRIIYVLPSKEIPVKSIVEQAKKISEGATRTVVAIPKNATAIIEAAADLDGWLNVRGKTAELAGDHVARRELSARISAAEQSLDTALAEAFGWGDRTASTSATWLYNGQILENLSPRQLAKNLSEIFDREFRKAPTIKNELLNRRSLSASAASARRTLVERMLENGHEENLGISGYPPEMSMYASMLKQSGLHSQRKGRWSFGEPSPDESNFRPAWAHINEFFSQTEDGPRPISELRETLASPPFGIKEGPFSVLLFAAIVASGHELALFEDGTFIPKMTSALVERFLRRPDSFSVARYSLDDRRRVVLNCLSLLLGIPAEKSYPSEVLRTIVLRRNVLPKYASQTHLLSAEAISFREAIDRSINPLQTLFKDLPLALGLGEPGESDSVEQMALWADLYANRLAGALTSLESAYGALLERIRNQFAKQFVVSSAPDDFRAELSSRLRKVTFVVVDTRLHAFIKRALDTNLLDQEWLESISTLATNPQRPPKDWTDGEWERFQRGLNELSLLFNRAEDLAMDQASEGPASDVVECIRVSVAIGGRGNLTGRVSLRQAFSEKASCDEVRENIRGLLERELGSNLDAWLVCLGPLVREVLERKSLDAPEAATPEREEASR